MDLHTVTAVVPAEPGRWQPGDAWVAGGTVLFAEPRPHVTRLLDLAALRWPPLTVRDDGLEIAATCTVAELLAFAAPPAWTAFHELVGKCCHAFVASFKIWNMATVGGNLCTALPAGPMISLTAALDGTCRILTPDGGERSLSVLDLVTGDGTTALAPGELLRSIHLPLAALTTRAAFRQGSLYPLGRSAALVIGRDDGVITVTAATVRPVRTLSDAVYVDDVHGDPVWRRHLTEMFIEEIRSELGL